MRALIGWLCALLLGSLGWWMGAWVGFGTAVTLGVLASAAGLWLGYRWFDQYLG